MPYCRTHTLAWDAPRVFDAGLAASNPGFAVVQADPPGGHLYLDQRRQLGGLPRRFAVSVTDNGLGSTLVHIAWRSRWRPWPLRSEGRSALRLCRCTERFLAAGRPPSAEWGAG